MARGVQSCAVLLSLVLAACGGGGLAATQSQDEGLAATRSQDAGLGAVIETGSGVFTFEADSFIECLGESVHSSIAAPYTYRLVSTPGGDSVYVELWNNPEITGTLTGLTSGRIWYRVRNVSPLVDRSMGGGMTMYTFRGTFIPAEETGPTIEARETYHVSRDANGTVRVDLSRTTFRCRLR